MSHLRILLFAGLAETCGSTFLEVELPSVCTVAELELLAITANPRLHHATFRVAVNSVYADATDLIPEDAEVAFLPPVSGG